MRTLRSRLGRVVVLAAACCGYVGTQAFAQDTPQLEITTSQGCGAGAVFPKSQTLSITVRAVGIPEGQGVGVHLTFINALMQKLITTVTLSSAVPEKMTPVLGAPYPPGPLQIQGEIIGQTVVVTCEVTMADITPNPTASPTVTGTSTPTVNPSLTATFTPTVSVTPTATFSQTPTATRTLTATPTSSLTPTRSPTPQSSATPTSSPLPTLSATPTLPGTATFSPTVTPSPTEAIITATPSSTATNVPSPSPTATVGGPRGDANCDGLVSMADIVGQVHLIGVGNRAACRLDDADGDSMLDLRDVDAAVAILFGD
jgi:hypothetical protein